MAVQTACAAAVVFAMAGCSPPDSPASSTSSEATLNVGFGLTTGQSSDAGIRERVRALALEGLVNFSFDGRPQPRLAERWATSSDGLTLRVWLRPGVTFHSGHPVTASVVQDILKRDLPKLMDDPFQDIDRIRASGEYELEFGLNKPSAFVLEGLEVLIQEPGSAQIGTGPFYPTSQTGAESEMLANDHYHSGRPKIDRLVLRSYPSVRAAWADLLRGRVDVVYEVGVDALDLFEPSTETKVFSFERNYTYTVILNVRKPLLRDPAFRRALNAAVDRRALIEQALKGHGVPADGPVSRRHWAYSDVAPRFEYRPQPVAVAGGRPRLKCLISDPSHERIALLLQRQLRDIGVEVEFEQVPIDKAMGRVIAGDFDAWLADTVTGPALMRSYWFWHSTGPYNWGGYHSARTDAALDAIRHARDDDAYRTGVAAFQRAIVDDPPAVFLAWSQRARAVSTRFEVPVEPGRDVWSTLRMWRPIVQGRPADAN